MSNSFAGSIPLFYEKHMVPMIFETYAEDIAARVVADNAIDILETAAGTGIVTRKLVKLLNESVRITATDISDPMIALARTLEPSNRVYWQQADALELPFDDRSYDLIISQFGAMFFANKRQAFTEAYRVLKPGGAFVFNVWDRIESNQFVHTVNNAVAEMFPESPPSFINTVPHGYYDPEVIAVDLALAGFKNFAHFETVTRFSYAPSARAAALAYCHGTPLHDEIKSRDANRVEEAVERATAALEKNFGRGPISGEIKAHIVRITR